MTHTVQPNNSVNHLKLQNKLEAQCMEDCLNIVSPMDHKSEGEENNPI